MLALKELNSMTSQPSNLSISQSFLTRDQLERYLIDCLIDSSQEQTRCEDLLARARTAPLELERKLAHSQLKPVADQIKGIAQGYTSDRQKTIAPLDAEGCRAYALYYTLINFEKMSRLLQIAAPLLPEGHLSVLDYGAGPGTATFAATSVLGRSFALTAVDSSAGMRSLASRLLEPLRQFGTLTRCTVESSDVFFTRRSTDNPFDLIVASHVLNEFPADRQQALIGDFLKHLAPGGTMVLLESALPAQTRELMSLRDWALNQDMSLQVHFPCTHRAACPMLADAGNWCHAPLSWNPPHLVRQIDALTGFNKHRLKYSAVILSRRNVPLADGFAYRVVAPPESSKAGHTATLCGPEWYGLAKLGKRDRSDDNLEFRRADLFDHLTLSDGLSDKGRIESTTSITRKRAP